jgi:pimeloyl-ACP methyl ester carboxylesterase
MKLHYETFFPSSLATKSKLPVVILHGLLGSSTNWRTLSRTLGERLHRPILAADLRNHGRSPRCPPGSRMLDYAHDVLDTFLPLPILTNSGRNGDHYDNHNVEGVHILGHSLGGMLGTLAALNAPLEATKPAKAHKVHSLIVVDWSNNWKLVQERSISRFLRTMQQVNDAFFKERSVVRDLLLKIDTARVVDSLLLNLKAVPDGSWKFDLPVESLREDLRRAYNDDTADLEHYLGHKSIAELPAKVTIVRGAQSSYVNAYGVQMFERLFPAVTVRTLDGCGHWPHVDRPADFLAAVEGHFSPDLP